MNLKQLLRKSRLLSDARQMWLFHTAQVRVWDNPIFRLKIPSFVSPEEYETEEQILVRRLQPYFDLFIDVGANIGIYSGMCAKLGKQVVSIEPVSHNRKYLLNLIKLNNFQDRISIIAAALGPSSGQSKIFGEQAGASLMSHWYNTPASRSRTTRMLTLDEVLATKSKPGHEPSILIKIDVEGYEWEVLKGAMKTLNRRPMPTWLVEIHRMFPIQNKLCENPNFKATLDCFIDKGYHCVCVLPDGNLKSISQVDIESELEDLRTDERLYMNYLFYDPNRINPRSFD